MNAKPHSPEWLIANADHGVAFERACASALERLLAENASLQQQLEAIGAGGVGPLVSTAVQHQHDFGGKNDLQRKADDSVTSCSTTAADWKLVPVVPTEEMLDAGRNACEGRFYPQDMLHGPRAMMADRWVAMLDAAPQPPTTEQSSAVERPQGERHLGVLMPSRSLVDQVIREIARYCNTGEMDDAESLLAELQFSIDPAQQPPTTEQSSAVERPQGKQEPDAFYEWRNMRPSLTRLQAWLLWKDQAKAEGGAA